MYVTYIVACILQQDGKTELHKVHFGIMMTIIPYGILI